MADFSLFAHSELFDEVSNQLQKSLGCPKPESKLICRELLRALHCVHKAHESSLELPRKIQLAWQFAVLNTKLYREFCQDVFGEFIEHSTVQSLQINTTRAIYQELFKELPLDSIWKADDPTKQKQETEVESEDEDEDEDDFRLFRDDEEEDLDEFTIHVKTLTGKTITLHHIRADTSILDLKHMFELAEGTPLGNIRFIYAGRQLEDDKTCSWYNLKNESMINLFLRLAGC
jgi:hypothetical protein